MVRLFALKGQGQHDLNPIPPEPYKINPGLSLIPATTGACVVTALIWAVGKYKAGTFLRSVAYWQLSSIGFCACSTYGLYSIQKPLYRREGIEANPGKIWQRSSRLTVDDGILAGGLFGLALALRKNRFQKVTGWKRHFGSIAVGASAGELAVLALNHQMPIERAARAEQVQRQRAVAWRLKQEEDFQSSLSFFGQLLLNSLSGGDFKTTTSQPKDATSQSEETTSRRPTTSEGPTAVFSLPHSEMIEMPIRIEGLPFHKEDPQATLEENLAKAAGFHLKMFQQYIDELVILHSELSKKEYEEGYYNIHDKKEAAKQANVEATLLRQLLHIFVFQKATHEMLFSNAAVKYAQVEWLKSRGVDDQISLEPGQPPPWLLEPGQPRPWSQAPDAHGVEPDQNEPIDPVLITAFLRHFKRSHSQFLKHGHGKTRGYINDDEAKRARREMEVIERWLKSLKGQTQRSEEYIEQNR